MPIVPIVDSPTVSPQAGGFQPYAAPGVEPVKNFAPDQAVKMGAATQAAGQQMIKIGEMVQDQIDDANTKAAVSWYTNQATKIMYDKESGYLNTLGLGAKDAYPKTVEAFQNIEQTALRELKNPLQQQMFSAVAARHKESFAAQLDSHFVKQMRVYGAGEADAMKDEYVKLAIMTPDSTERQVTIGAAQAQVDAKADLLGLPKDSVQRKEMKADVVNKVSFGIANDLITKEDWKNAKGYLDQQYKNGEIDPKDFQTLSRTVNVGLEKQEATTFADNVFKTSVAPAGNSDKNTVIDFVMKRLEGGYVENDAGAGPTNHGINSKAYFGVKNAKDLTEAQKNFIKNLTPDQAKDIYRKKYWDNINLDKVDPSIRLMAFDTAVNMGPDVAKKFIQESGGDLDKFAKLRKERYAKIAAGNDDKKQFLTGWNNRVDQVLNLSRGGQESLESQLARTDSIKNPDVREMARTKIIGLNNERDSVERKDYQDVLDRAIAISSKNPSSWTEVPAADLAKLKEGDKQKLRNAADRQSDQNTLLYVQTHPEEWTADKLKRYRMLLSESDYRGFAAKAAAPNFENKVIEVGYDQDQLKQKLVSFGLEKLVHPKQNSSEEKERIKLNAQLEQNINLLQESYKRKLTFEEKNKLIENMLKPVKVKAVEGWWNKTDTTMDKLPFQVNSKLNIIVPPQDKKIIEQKFKDAGVRYNEETIIDSYLLNR